MLAPHELKSKTFSKSLKGYTPAEVDEYIEFLIGKYTEVYRENNELERKLHVVVTNLDEIKDEEESIRSTLISAQKMADKIIKDANDRADVITGAIKERCDAVIAEFREQLQAEKEEMWAMRTRIVEFKKDLFDLYRGHIESLKEISVNEIDEIVLPNEDEVVTRIFTDVKQGIEESNGQIAASKIDELEEAPVGAGAESGGADSAAPDSTELAKKAEDDYLRFMMGEEDADLPE